MTQQRDIERVLDHWLSDGPTQSPDRVMDVVTDRIERQSQRPAWRLDWRHPRMNTNLKVATAVAAAVLIAVIGYQLLPASQSGFGGPGPVATPSPSPTPSPPALPDGRLTAGDYVARALPGDPMAFTVTVPEGWSGFGGWAISGPTTNSAPNGIGIVFLHGPQVVGDPCDPSAREPSPAPSAPSVDDLVASLSARGDLRVSGVTDTVLGGYSGTRLDLQLPAELTCSQYYVFAEPQGFYAQGRANRWRVWVLDVDGETAVVVLEDFAGTSAADRAAAQAAIDSLRITP